MARKLRERVRAMIRNTQRKPGPPWQAYFVYEVSGDLRTHAPMPIMDRLAALEGVMDNFPSGQLNHVLQTAENARLETNDEELVLAALLHDIGKTIRIQEHAHIGADLICRYVPARVTWLVANHFLVEHESEVSCFAEGAETLRTLRSHRWYLDALRLKEWDTRRGKKPGYEPPGLEAYESLLEKYFPVRYGFEGHPVQRYHNA